MGIFDRNPYGALAGPMTVTSGGGSGSVTSVALSVPSFLSVAGSPITTSGTLAVTLATQAANIVFAGPGSGGAATPTFRAIVAADLPTIGPTKGGTGLTSYTTGDTLYSSASNVLSKLGIGTTGQVLTVAAGLPSWATPTAVSSFDDTAFDVHNLASPTKIFKLDLSGMTAGQTVKLKPEGPNGSGTTVYTIPVGFFATERLVTETANQTLNNKILDGDGGIRIAQNLAFSPFSYGGGTIAFLRQWFTDGNLSIMRASASDENRIDVRHTAVRCIASTGTFASDFENGDTVDGVVLATNDRILLNIGTANTGIYKVNASGAPTRTFDFNVSSDFYRGLSVHVDEGTINANTDWLVTNTGAITIDSTTIVFRTSSVVYYEATSAGGAATETMTFTGLGATDDILSVCQRVDGGAVAATSLIGWANQAANALDVTWTLDPGAGAVIRIAVRKR